MIFESVERREEKEADRKWKKAEKTDENSGLNRKRSSNYERIFVCGQRIYQQGFVSSFDGAGVENNHGN